VRIALNRNSNSETFTRLGNAERFYYGYCYWLAVLSYNYVNNIIAVSLFFDRKDKTLAKTRISHESNENRISLIVESYR